MVAALTPGPFVTPREEVLLRIRTALGREAGTPAGSGSGTPAAPRSGPQAGPGAGTGTTGGPAYRTAGSLDRARLLDLLAERLADYHAGVRRTAPASLAATVAAALTERGARRLVVPPGLNGLLPLTALPDGVEAVTDDGLSPEELDGMDGVITGASVAIAQTGTIVLDGSPGQGRRAITLVPDYHLCIVQAAQVVELVPEAVARLAGAAGRPLTWVSGPSATSDIELSRVEGVHGPRTLEVILTAES
jgi:L-lactate dehydrogenase complex protein LldG